MRVSVNSAEQITSTKATAVRPSVKRAQRDLRRPAVTPTVEQAAHSALPEPFATGPVSFSTAQLAQAQQRAPARARSVVTTRCTPAKEQDRVQPAARDLTRAEAIQTLGLLAAHAQRGILAMGHLLWWNALLDTLQQLVRLNARSAETTQSFPPPVLLRARIAQLSTTPAEELPTQEQHAQCVQPGMRAMDPACRPRVNRDTLRCRTAPRVPSAVPTRCIKMKSPNLRAKRARMVILRQEEQVPPEQSAQTARQALPATVTARLKDAPMERFPLPALISAQIAQLASTDLILRLVNARHADRAICSAMPAPFSSAKHARRGTTQPGATSAKAPDAPHARLGTNAMELTCRRSARPDTSLPVARPTALNAVTIHTISHIRTLRAA